MWDYRDYNNKLFLTLPHPHLPQSERLTNLIKLCFKGFAVNTCPIDNWNILYPTLCTSAIAVLILISVECVLCVSPSQHGVD